MKKRNHITFDRVLITVFFFVLAYLAYFHYQPFESYLDVRDIFYHDMCVGDQTQLVTAYRLVSHEGFPAKTHGELFTFDGVKKLETIIKREAFFTYQPSATPVTYEVEWKRPVTEPGEYGASDFITIYPLPFIEKSKYFSEEGQRFNVNVCEN